MSYRQWKQQTSVARGYGGPFWPIVDFNWTAEEQNRLAREWKNGSVT
jgi:hypothetical protein